jgi:hypothetical protein
MWDDVPVLLPFNLLNLFIQCHCMPDTTNIENNHKIELLFSVRRQSGHRKISSVKSIV